MVLLHLVQRGEYPPSWRNLDSGQGVCDAMGHPGPVVGYSVLLFELSGKKCFPPASYMALKHHSLLMD